MYLFVLVSFPEAMSKRNANMKPLSSPAQSRRPVGSKAKVSTCPITLLLPFCMLNPWLIAFRKIVYRIQGNCLLTLTPFPVDTFITCTCPLLFPIYVKLSAYIYMWTSLLWQTKVQFMEDPQIHYTVHYQPKQTDSLRSQFLG